jgi:hypothetical protein
MQWGEKGPLMALLTGSRHHLEDGTQAPRLDGTQHCGKSAPTSRRAAASMAPAAPCLWDQTPQAKGPLALASLVLGSREP